MTICNMSIEAGARAGIISPDEKTVDYLNGKRRVPIGEKFTELAGEWLALATDEGAAYDQTVTIQASEVEPQVTWRTNPSMGAPARGRTPSIQESEDQEGISQTLKYIALSEHQTITSI